MLDLVLLAALNVSPGVAVLTVIPAVTVKKKKKALPKVEVKKKKALPKFEVKASPKSDTVKSTACDLSKAPPFSQVPQAPGLSKYRAAILRKAAEELGEVRVHEEGLSIPPLFTAKKGADRLLEYSIVAYGSDPGGWLGHALPEPGKQHLLPLMFRMGAKHTTWCGIFALWAAKSGAAVTADDYAPALAGALANPVIALLAATFMEFYAPSWADNSRWAAMKKVEWRNGVGFTVPVGNGRKQKLPRAVSTWFSKGQAPPIQPGDIGYTVITVAPPDLPKWDGKSHHHYLVEKVHHTPEGHIIYYTLEGNFHDQQVMRWKRCYNGAEGIDYFYDVDTLADPP